MLQPTPLRAWSTALDLPSTSKAGRELADAVAQLSFVESSLGTPASGPLRPPSRSDEDVLEEFLTIMHPSRRPRTTITFGFSGRTSSSRRPTPNTSSPLLFSRSSSTSSSPAHDAWALRRAHPYRRRASSSSVRDDRISSSLSPNRRTKSSTASRSPMMIPAAILDHLSSVSGSSPCAVISEVLRASPILRIHTRNPLARNRSCESLAGSGSGLHFSEPRSELNPMSSEGMMLAPAPFAAVTGGAVPMESS